MPQRIRAGCDSSVVDLTITRPHFATAHSRGLRRKGGHVLSVSIDLCHSAFARVATERAIITTVRHDLCHSAFARVATIGSRAKTTNHVLCHSAFARVATIGSRAKTTNHVLCHSAFARVATNAAYSPESYVRHLCHSAFARVATAEKQCSALRICCEKVDSFSSVGESGLALTIFPFSFAAKATYVAINDSFGRAIDRFFGANRTGISVSYDFAEHPCL